MLKDNLEKIFNEIHGGNNLGEKITLVGATKMVDTSTINEAISLGLKIVGDNKVQEFNEKSPLIKDAEFHFIGHLQTNKVKYLIGKVSLIQSVDSVKLAEEISKQSVNKNFQTNILLEVNVGGELSKSGFTADNIENEVYNIAKLPNIKILGLMAMLPKLDDKNILQKLCLQMREIYDRIKENDKAIKYLSIGMSGDYQIAIKNGSNMIRLGSKLFGERNY